MVIPSVKWQLRSPRERFRHMKFLSFAIVTGFVLGGLGIVLGVTGPNGEMVLCGCVLWGASTIAKAIVESRSS